MSRLVAFFAARFPAEATSILARLDGFEDVFVGLPTRARVRRVAAAAQHARALIQPGSGDQHPGLGGDPGPLTPRCGLLRGVAVWQVGDPGAADGAQRAQAGSRVVPGRAFSASGGGMAGGVVVTGWSRRRVHDGRRRRC